MTTQFRNLVFEGGGMKGLAYVGAMQIMEQRGHLSGIQRVGGTSAGGINALMFALGYSMQEQREKLESTDFNKFLDDSFGFGKDINRLTTSFGWNKGDYFLEWISDLIKNKLGNKKATFQDLIDDKRPALYVTGTNLSSGYVEFFSAEGHPDMPLADALRISMSMPLYFAAVRHGVRNDCYVDGGVILNYPVKLFDRQRYIDLENEPKAVLNVDYYNRENAELLLNDPDRSPYVYNRQTLGLRLDNAKEIGLFRSRRDKPVPDIEMKEIKKIDDFNEISDFFDYLKALISAFTNVQGNQHLHTDDWQRTIYIDTLDIKTAEFNLTADRKLALIREGIKGAEEYFKWFEDDSKPSINKII